MARKEADWATAQYEIKMVVTNTKIEYIKTHIAEMQFRLKLYTNLDKTKYYFRNVQPSLSLYIFLLISDFILQMGDTQKSQHKCKRKKGQNPSQKYKYIVKIFLCGIWEKLNCEILTDRVCLSLWVSFPCRRPCSWRVQRSLGHACVGAIRKWAWCGWCGGK